MKIDEHANRLIERIGVLRHPSDLDLLIFFARHPRSLLASEHLATLLGYGIKEIAASLDLLVDGGLVTRTQSQRHAARMYLFAVSGRGNGWLPDLMKLASTREGRLALIWALRHRASGDSGGPVARAGGEPIDEAASRPFLIRRNSGAGKRTKTG